MGTSIQPVQGSSSFSNPEFHPKTTLRVINLNRCLLSVLLLHLGRVGETRVNVCVCVDVFAEEGESEKY